MVLCMGNTEEQQPSMEPAEFDPTFHGPIHDRGCTDVVCAALFLAVLFFHVVLGFVAWGNGNPKHILYPKNSTGHFCGIDENLGKPYVYYYDPTKCSINLKDIPLDGFPCPTIQVCVKKCPRTTWAFKFSELKTYKDILQNGKGSEVPCVEGTNMDEIPKTEGDYKEACPYFHIKTLPMMGRCVPEVTRELDPGDLAIMTTAFPGYGGESILWSSINTGRDMRHIFNSRGFTTMFVEDFAAAWGWIVLSLFMTMVLSLSFLLMLRYTAGFIVWGTLAGIVILGATMAFFCFQTYKAGSATDMDLVGKTGLEDAPETWLAFFIILVALDVIVLVVIIFLRERLRIAIAIIQEASKAVGYMKLTLFYPVVTFVLVVLCVGFWGVVSLYLVTFGNLEYHVKLLNPTLEEEKEEKCIGKYNITQTCDPSSFEEDEECKTARCVLKDYKAGFVQKNIEWMHAYNLFSSLWAVNFVIALGQCTLAGAFASYYWAFFKPGDIPKWPLLAAFTRTLRFHVGSLAFGSLIITLLQIVRVILEYVDHKTKDAQNPAIKFFTKCLKCLFWCLEKFIKFLNRNAYIMIAVYGNNFCLSAKNAFFLLLRNVVRVVVLDKVTDLLVFFGKLIVVGTVSGLFYCLFAGTLAEHGIAAFQPGELHFSLMPIVTVSVGSYVIASGFFSVYTMCVDTLFLCFLEDLERNDGSQQKPYYMSSNLMKILDKSNQPRKKGKRRLAAMVLCMGNTEEQQPSMEPAEFDPTFHGPIHDRGCTDVVCTALFLAVLFFHVVLGFVAWGNGNPKLILYPKNSTGHFCGIDENADKPYVYYYDPMKCATPTNLAESALNGFPCPTTQVCVKKCPSTVWVFNPVDFMKNPNGEKKTFKQVLQNGKGSEVPCVESKNVDETIPSVGADQLGDVLTAYINAEECPYFHIKTLPMMGRCVPDIGTELDASETKRLDDGLKNEKQHINLGDGATILQKSNNTAYDMKHVFNARGFSTKIFEDFAAAWGWIVLGLFMAMVFSLIFLLLLRYTAGPIVWGTLAGIVILLATLAFFSFETYEYLKKDKTAKRMDESMTDLEEYLMVPETWLAFFIILVALDVIVLVMIIFLRERLRIAIAIIQEASKAVGYMKLTLAYPVVTFVLVVLCVGFWGVVSLYLVTFVDPEYHVKLLNATLEEEVYREKCIGKYNITQPCDPISFEEDKECKTARCVLKDYKAGFVKKHIEWMHAYNLFSSLWAVNFVIALGQCTLAGAFASYYWAFCKPGDIPKWPLLAAFTRTLRFHVGSLAFGSLIITLLQIVRMILEYVDHKTKDAQNPAIKFFTKCLKCLFWCLEKFLKFLNRNAYIMIAVYGNNFCLSAKNAFFLLLRNVVRVVVLDKVTDLLVFFGKLIVVGTVSGLFYCVFSGALAEHGITAFQPGELHYHWMPIITVSVGSYVIASGFFSVYTMCVDTLFLCFLEDLERNDGSQQKPYYMSSNLMRILDKSNQPRKKG